MSDAYKISLGTTLYIFPWQAAFQNPLYLENEHSDSIETDVPIPITKINAETEKIKYIRYIMYIQIYEIENIYTKFKANLAGQQEQSKDRNEY